MSRKQRVRGVAAAFGIAAAGLAAAQEGPNMPTIVIDHAALARKKPLSEAEREYWRCVLEHLKGTQGDEAVAVILAACRALYGSD